MHATKYIHVQLFFELVLLHTHHNRQPMKHVKLMIRERTAGTRFAISSFIQSVTAATTCIPGVGTSSQNTTSHCESHGTLKNNVRAHLEQSRVLVDVRAGAHHAMQLLGRRWAQTTTHGQKPASAKEGTSQRIDVEFAAGGAATDVLRIATRARSPREPRIAAQQQRDQEAWVRTAPHQE
jgi:hypothetical protein